ncbi:MAG: hypothetical protein ACI81L_002830 [Verrucomicrobiales bacterium]|jgi:hypothetical protein
MGAIVEPARRRRIGDVGKDLLQRIFSIPKTDGANSRGIDEHSAGGNPQHVAGDRGVTALCIAGPNGLRVLHIGFHEGINERTLPRTRLTEERA